MLRHYYGKSNLLNCNPKEKKTTMSSLQSPHLAVSTKLSLKINKLAVTCIIWTYSWPQSLPDNWWKKNKWIWQINKNLSNQHDRPCRRWCSSRWICHFLTRNATLVIFCSPHISPFTLKILLSLSPPWRVNEGWQKTFLEAKRPLHDSDGEKW